MEPVRRRRRRKKPADDLSLGNDGVLPTEVLYDVLLRLPANAICRLRVVCRSWRSLTSDPGFATAHASRHPLLAGVRDREVRVVDLLSGDTVRRMAPAARPRYGMNSQLDLVCISAFSTHERSSLLNPATGEVITTFLPDWPEKGTDVMSPFLLGHIPSTGQLKAFYSHLRRGEGGFDEPVQTCYVAKLIGGGGGGSGIRWRATRSPPAFVGSGLRDSVVIEGVAYILLTRSLDNEADILDDLEPDAMAVFEMTTEKWRPAALRGPLSSRLTGAADEKELVYYEHRGNVRLAAVDGCLVTVDHNRGPDCSMDLWFLVDMDVDKGIWTKRYSLRCETRCELYESSKSSDSYPLLVLDDGRIVMWEEVTHVLRVYDPRASKWDDITTVKNYSSVSIYRGNLLCPL
ncbi:unnamed protein product [Urochloa decumbens]|uniref:F-box domain-containing protein n=1 Tax=Urochloa decumbens TaxID=240449 RepID=A0ABC9G9Z8_9POAL